MKAGRKGLVSGSAVGALARSVTGERTCISIEKGAS